MRGRGVAEWASQPKNRDILAAFSIPNMPARVEKELCIKKLKLGPFLKKNLLLSLNPGARKGRLYCLTNKARKLLNLPLVSKAGKDWDIKGWLLSSPKQKRIIMKLVDSEKRTSEEIREKASQFNPCLSRTSTKDILKELVKKGLIETELNDRTRLYWLSNDGMRIKKQIESIRQISPLSSAA